MSDSKWFGRSFTAMDKTEWWWTGRNNATDSGYNFGYFPPRGVGFVCGLWYRAGWIVGKFFPNPKSDRTRDGE